MSEFRCPHGFFGDGCPKCQEIESNHKTSKTRILDVTDNKKKIMKNKRIPISVAKKISQDYNFQEVVIFAYDPETGNQHITTYGKTKDQCIDAAKAGNFLKRALGWPEKLCNAKPTKQDT